MFVMGVRSSWLTFAAKSLRIETSRRSAVTSSAAISRPAGAPRGSSIGAAASSRMPADAESSVTSRRAEPPAAKASFTNVCTSGERTTSWRSRPRAAPPGTAKSRSAAAFIETTRCAMSSARIPVVIDWRTSCCDASCASSTRWRSSSAEVKRACRIRISLLRRAAIHHAATAPRSTPTLHPSIVTMKGICATIIPGTCGRPR